MANCLGIYLGDNIVKYAKISLDGEQVNIEQCGTRIIKESKKELIQNLIEETKSHDIPLVINSQNDKYTDFEIYDQMQNNNASYISGIIKTEFDAWCEKQRLNVQDLAYVYSICDIKNDEGKRKAVLNYTQKSTIDNFKTVEEKNVEAMYPVQLILTNMVKKEDKNYVLVDLDRHIAITTIVNGMLADFKSYDVGMLQVLEEFSIKLGSIAKAYEACKRINTYTEGESSNDPQLESILEPILQDILRYVLAVVNKNRKVVDKVLITGLGTIFTNIDILFQEYLDIKCEILKPEFAMKTTDVRNLSETIEALPAISLAYEYLNSGNSKNLSYINGQHAQSKNKKKIFSSNKTFGQMFQELKSKLTTPKNPSEPAKSKAQDAANPDKPKKKAPVSVDFATESLIQTVTVFCIVVGMIFVSYLAFDQIYIGSINKNISDMDNKIDRLKSQAKEIESDINYTDTNMKKYKDINDQVSMVVSQIESNEIGKFSTYNVAYFLQQIIKIIPEEVQLITISSDDNKNIEIVAESNDYSDLGYFVAQLKLQGILNSTKIKDVKNGERITITIGGELP